MSAARPHVKGRCPGALLPMAAKDGLIMRVRPRFGVVSQTQLTALADAASKFGDGHLHVSNRANLNLRGLTPESHEKALAALAPHGLIDEDEAQESARNILVDLSIALGRAPQAQAYAAALEALVREEPLLHGISAKFGYAFEAERDDGTFGMPPTADITLSVKRDGTALIWLQGALDLALPLPSPDALREMLLPVLAVFRGLRANAPNITRMRDAVALVGGAALLGENAISCLLPRASAVFEVGPLESLGAYGVAFPFGDVRQDALQDLIHLMATHAIARLAVTPSRALVLAGTSHTSASAIEAFAQRYGAITNPADIRLRIQACIGANGCAHATTDTRQHALAVADALANHAFTGVIHISGCDKKCAHTGPAALLAIGHNGEYLVAEPATGAKRSVSPDDLPAFFLSRVQ